MRKLTAGEIKTAAKRITDSYLAGYGLQNAKKVALTVRQLLLKEQKRREAIEKK